MQVLINRVSQELPSGCTVEQALSLGQFKPPYVVALNMTFLPKTAYASTTLQPSDELEVISPITGG